MVTTTPVSNANGTSNNSRRRLLLVSCPRTASNLLTKILALPDQPNHLTNEQAGYYFYNAFMFTMKGEFINKPSDQWTEDEKAQIQVLFQQCFDKLEEESALAEKDGKVVFAKEHAFWFVNPMALGSKAPGSNTHDNDTEKISTLRINIPAEYGPTQTYSDSNCTVFSDEYLRTWQLAFLIRHPALAFPSLVRAMKKLDKLGILESGAIMRISAMNMTLHWSRAHYDWAAQQPDANPVVLDAKDVIHNPQALIRFCELTGLDANALKFEWESKDSKSDVVVNGDQMHHGKDRKDTINVASGVMLGTLRESSGVLKSKAPETIDIEVEAKLWKEEFGGEMAKLVEKAVWDAMPDYEYLKSKRLVI